MPYGRFAGGEPLMADERAEEERTRVDDDMCKKA